MKTSKSAVLSLVVAVFAQWSPLELGAQGLDDPLWECRARCWAYDPCVEFTETLDPIACVACERCFLTFCGENPVGCRSESDAENFLTGKKPKRIKAATTPSQKSISWPADEFTPQVTQTAAHILGLSTPFAIGEMAAVLDDETLTVVRGDGAILASGTFVEHARFSFAPFDQAVAEVGMASELTDIGLDAVAGVLRMGEGPQLFVYGFRGRIGVAPQGQGTAHTFNSFVPSGTAADLNGAIARAEQLSVPYGGSGIGAAPAGLMGIGIGIGIAARVAYCLVQRDHCYQVAQTVFDRSQTGLASLGMIGVVGCAAALFFGPPIGVLCFPVLISAIAGVSVAQMALLAHRQRRCDQLYQACLGGQPFPSVTMDEMTTAVEWNLP